jgi:hypothetical protein
MKPGRKSLLLAAACALVGYATVFVVQRGDFPAVLHHHADPLARQIRAEDSKFLDDLVHKQNEPVPKAELVVNSEIVKRGELVVHNGRIKHAELVQRRRQ